MLLLILGGAAVYRCDNLLVLFTALAAEARMQSREWDSSQYHRLSEPQLSWGKKLFSRLSLRGDEVLLDAGCGTGRLTAELLQALPRGQVVALDLSQNMLRTAHEFLAPQFGQRVRFVAADLQALPFEDAFDGVVSTAAFHWVPDHNRLFRNLHHALRPSGWLHAQCGGGPNLLKLRTRVNSLMASGPYSHFFSGFREPWVFADAETAADILQRVGFVDVETGLEPAFTILDDAKQYSEFLPAIILRMHLQCLPDPELRARFIAELTEQAKSDNPPFSLDYWRLNLSAKAS
jgi:trans-aconitate methyltransferase